MTDQITTEDAMEMTGGGTMTSAEVAAIFGVSPKTIVHWVKGGKLKAFKTPGGHRRFRKSDVADAYEAANREP